MSSRYWRVAANFHRIGDVIVTVQGPNWQTGLRKAALVIKRLPELKGRRLSSGTFMIQEVDSPPPVQEASEQLLLVQEEQEVEEGETQPATTSEPD